MNAQPWTEADDRLVIDSPVDIVTRAAVRASLGAGRVRDIGRSGHESAMLRGSTGRKNVASVKFQDALRRFERAGWIERGPDTLRIINRAALNDFANGGAP